MSKSFKFFNKCQDIYDCQKINKFLTEHSDKNKSLLDLNTGTGKHLFELKKLGFDVYGTTKTSTVSAKASLPMVNGSACSIKSKEKFDVITYLFNGIGNLSNYYYLDKLFANIEKHLSSDGVVIIDILKASNLSTSNWVSLNENINVKLKKYNKHTRVAKIETEVISNGKRQSFIENYKSFSLIKLRKIANKNNLTIVKAYNNWSDEIAGQESYSVQLILQRSPILPKELQKKYKHQKVTKSGKIKTVTTRSFIVTMIMVISVGALSGSTLGKMYIDNFLNTPNYSSYSEEFLRDNPASIRYQGKTPDKLTPTQAFVVAESLLTTSSNKWTMTKNGEIQNSFKPQTLSGLSVFDGNVLSNITESNGFKTFVEKTESEIGSNTVNCFTGSKQNDDYVWNNPETITVDSYREVYGISPQSVINYIISSKTVNDYTEWNKNDGKYTASLSLNPVSSVILYIKQMLKTSGLNVAPTFNSINITFTLDENYRLLSFNIVEEYVVKFGLTVKCKAIINTDFNYN